MEVNRCIWSDFCSFYNSNTGNSSFDFDALSLEYKEKVCHNEGNLSGTSKIVSCGLKDYIKKDPMLIPNNAST